MTAPNSIYTDELARTICDMLADGYSLTDICKLENMPARRTVLYWLDEGKEPLCAWYARAREAQADTMDDKILSTARGISSAEEAQIARVQIAAYQWRAEKLKPRVYGAKQQVDTNVTITRKAADMTDDEIVAEMARLAGKGA